MTEERLAAFVLDFAREMNALQSRYGPQIKQAQGREYGLIFDAYRQEAEAVYDRFLTKRKRVCYFGISQPPFFCALEDTASWTVEAEKKRAAVTVLPQRGSLDFRFLLRESGGEWRINSFQQRCRGQRVYPWTYGCF